MAVDEARRALLPDPAVPARRKRGKAAGDAAGSGAEMVEAHPWPTGLKSFDFVLYAETRNLLIDIKGRKVSRRMGGVSSIREANARRRLTPVTSHDAEPAAGEDDGAALTADAEGVSENPGWSLHRRGRLESWVTQDDVDSLREWMRLFGPGYEAAFVFVYWCDEQPPDGLFQEVFDFQGRWYALRAIALADYLGAMKTRSARWKTVDLPGAEFERLSQPFASPWVNG